MEFTSRGNNQPAAQATGRRKHIDWAARTIRIEIFIILVGGALLLAAVSLFLGLSGNLNTNNESKQVSTSEFQAVFLNNGQVYFGKLTSVNSGYFVLNNVFYLESPSTSSSAANSTANNNYTLRKLGVSELHAPEDKMVINRSQVTFWENLKDSGKVVKAIQQYEKDPNAANQVQQSGSTGQASTTAPQTTTGTGATTQP